MNHCGGGNFKKQMKRADNSGAKIALVIGQDELEQQKVAIKFLREKQDQQTIAKTDLVTFIGNLFN
jgi:histidyl-tRNA synthetase